jgi:dephospho-CoA kinase
MGVWKHGRAKPVIGITGGIGAGKSTVGRLFGREGCAVIDADALSHDVIQTEEVKAQLRDWLGPGVFAADGTVDRRAVAREVFGDAGRVRRLNGLIHPRVGARRDALMGGYLADPAVRAVVWDTPLLREAGLDRDCDAVVHIDAPFELRLARVRGKRGWTAEELSRREKLQFPLDKKAELADYCIDNSGDEASSLRQIQRVLSHLLATSR